jgi:hypothetical protein
VLEEFLGRPKVAPLIAKDWIDLTLDTDRMTHGKEVYERLKKGRSGGLPWLVVLDPECVELITGVGPNGNIGAPVTPEECAHFMQMLRLTRIRLTDEELETIEAELEEHAAPRRRPRRR